VRTTGITNAPFTVALAPNDSTPDPVEISGGGSVEYEEVYTGDEESEKRWLCKTGDDGTWIDVDIDLCTPDNVSGNVDGQDWRFPLMMRMPKRYGVSRIPQIDFRGLPTGDDVTFEIDSISFVRLDGTSSNFDFLGTFYPHYGRVIDDLFIMNLNWPDAARWRPIETLDAGTRNTYYARRGILGRCDGKSTVDWFDLSYTYSEPPDGSTPVWSFAISSIQGWADHINGSDTVSLWLPTGDTTGSLLRYPRITATVDTPASDSRSNLHDGYLNSGLPCSSVAGGGIWYDPEHGFKSGLDTNGSVPVQFRCDSVETWAGCGDVFGLSLTDTAGAIILKGASILRSGGHGIVVGDDRKPIEGVTLEADEPVPTSRGTGTTDAASGYAQTGEEWMLGPATITMTSTDDGPVFSIDEPSATLLLVGKDRSVNITNWSKHRYRLNASCTTPHAWTVLAIDPARQYLYAGAEDQVFTYHLSTMSLVRSSDHHTEIETWDSLTYDERRASLFLSGKADGSTRKVYISRDGGVNISEVLSVDAKSSAIERDSERAILIMLYQEPTADVLTRQISRDGGASWETATAITVDGTSSVTGVVESMAQDARAGGVLLATVKAVSTDTVKVLRSRDCGLNWSTVLS